MPPPDGWRSRSPPRSAAGWPPSWSARARGCSGPRALPRRGRHSVQVRDAAGAPSPPSHPTAPRERPDCRTEGRPALSGAAPRGHPAFAPSTSVDGGRGSAGGAPDATRPRAAAPAPSWVPQRPPAAATALDLAGDDPAPGGRACRGRRPPGRHALEHRARPPRSRRLGRGGGRALAAVARRQPWRHRPGRGRPPPRSGAASPGIGTRGPRRRRCTGPHTPMSAPGAPPRPEPRPGRRRHPAPRKHP